MAEQRERRAKVKAGNGITEYERLPSVYDSESSIEKMRRGALVDASLRLSTAPFWPEIREQTVDLCRAIYAQAGKPDPFAWSDPAKKCRPVSLAQIERRGFQYCERLVYLGLEQNALREMPSEDHSDIWFASRMALVLVSIEVLIAKADSGTLVTIDSLGGEHAVPPGGAGRVFAMRGWELARLYTQYLMKVQHEKDAIGGKVSKQGREQSHVKRRQNSREDYAERFARMSDYISKGYSVNGAAEAVVQDTGEAKEQADLARMTNTLAKAYRKDNSDDRA